MRAAVGLVVAFVALSGCDKITHEDEYALYRNSPLDPDERVHVATFDTGYGEKYNRENCNIAAGYFKDAAGLQSMRYWCERGKEPK